jgi:microcystin degradation protein MlrC
VSKRVLIAQIMHETNTFSRLPTDIEAYRRRYLLFGDEILPFFRGTRTELGALIDLAPRLGWTLVPAVAANATPSGTVTAETWELLSGTLLKAARESGPIDGVVLALHGAMVTETADDAEGDLLERLRAVLGPDVPIAITLDLHANVTDKMAANANAIIAYRTYPHIDQYERASQAADLVRCAMAGEIRPHCVVARRPMLDGANGGITQDGPMVELLARADRHERDGVLAVSIHAGFAWADMADAGPSVAVTTDGADPRGSAIANELMDLIWATRDVRTVTALSLAAAMAIAVQPDVTGKPLVIADTTDNPGGGGYGDTTGLLRAMLDAGLTNACFAPICDGEAVEAGRRAGQGNRVRLKLGGKIDPAFGRPIEAEGLVVKLSDGKFVHDGPMHKGTVMNMGPTMVLRLAGIDVVVTTNRLQVTDHQVFLSQGIDPLIRSVIGLKSSHHFRAAFQPIARAVLVVDSGSLCSHDLSRFAYRKLRRPVWPLDPVA